MGIQALAEWSQEVYKEKVSNNNSKLLGKQKMVWPAVHEKRFIIDLIRDRGQRVIIFLSSPKIGYIR